MAVSFDELFKEQKAGSRRVVRDERFHSVPVDLSEVSVKLRSVRIREVWQNGKPTGRPDVDEEGKALVQCEFDFGFQGGDHLPVRSGYMRVDADTFERWSSLIYGVVEDIDVDLVDAYVRPSIADGKVSRSGSAYGGKTVWALYFDDLQAFDE